MSTAQKPRKAARFRQRRSWAKWLVLSSSLLVIVWLAFSVVDSSAPVENPHRCAVPWHTLERVKGLNICITTLSDAKSDSAFTATARRDFSDVLESTWSNRRAYAEAHGYQLFNASDLLDTQRPPSWSKILAVQDALKRGCDWVLWMDPDALFMNFNTRIEQVLPNAQNADFVFTRDSTGYNAGMWMVRNSDWSKEFLNHWWSMTSFIRLPGDTKSGDNDALKDYMEELDNTDGHIYTAPQCAFNSYLWNPGLKSWRRYLWDKDALMGGIYADGDFVLHFAGVDDKMKYIRKYDDHQERTAR